EDPQDKKYKGELEVRLEIGERNVIREFCTLNRGTVQGGGVTRIGDDNWIMAYCHIAHDCIVGNHTIFANNTSFGGHIQIEDYVILGAFTIVHQFCRLGMHSFSGGGSAISKDVLPFVTVSGDRAKAYGLNKEGLKRRGFSSETIHALHESYKTIFKRHLTTTQAIETLKELSEKHVEVQQMLTFLQQTTRGIVR
ncbi:MAG: acyl-ACP--UDP-N-acetylglucosamine O-acyltransferase, partial [Thiotrichaceae bacterium]|nr:acyl-ACP--UDP-N-acetylglucosamine O-acyltransferase [Thiotrichaceae bacterium]